MIPREFFDWAASQWWGAPAFVAIFLGALASFSLVMAKAAAR